MESISKYKVTARKARTIGRSLKGGINASYKLSSISVDVFSTIFFNFKTISFAKIPLMRSENIIEIRIIPKSNKLIPKTP